MHGLIRDFADDDSGATAIEYGLIAALVAVVLIGALRSLGDTMLGIFSSTSGDLEEVARCVEVGGNCKK